MVHANLKPENFLYESESEESVVKITDVSMYTILEKDLLRHSIESSFQYCGKFYFFNLSYLVLNKFSKIKKLLKF